MPKASAIASSAADEASLDAMIQKVGSDLSEVGLVYAHLALIDPTS